MTPCPVCGGDAGLLRPGLIKCAGCGLFFKSERSFSAPVYAPGLKNGIYGTAKNKLFASALDYFARELPEKGRLLDVGCAGGEFMKAAAARGWMASGVELDPALAVKAAEAGFEVSSRPVEEAGLDGAAYEAVTALEVFSQMNKPVAAALEIFRLLAPGGAVYIREFNAAFHLPLYLLERKGFFRPLGISPAVLHDFNFTAGSLRMLLERAGFSDIRIRNSPPTSGDPYRTGGRLGGFLTGTLKVLYYWLAQALWCATFGCVHAGSSLIATAREPAQP
jgi:SAM-dependent methyltransferase